MKKVLITLALLSVSVFAADKSDLADCTKNEIAKCEYLYTCKNDVSVLVVHNEDGDSCESYPSSKKIIINSNKTVIDVSNKN